MPAALMNTFYFKKIASQHAMWYGFNLCMWCTSKTLKFNKKNNNNKYYPLRNKFSGERL